MPPRFPTRWTTKRSKGVDQLDDLTRPRAKLGRAGTWCGAALTDDPTGLAELRIAARELRLQREERDQEDDGDDDQDPHAHRDLLAAEPGDDTAACGERHDERDKGGAQVRDQRVDEPRVEGAGRRGVGHAHTLRRAPVARQSAPESAGVSRTRPDRRIRRDSARRAETAP